MSPESASIVLYGVTAIALAVWLSAFEFLRRLGRNQSEAGREATERFTLDAPPEGQVITEGMELKGEPQKLSARLAAVLARDGLSMFGPVQLTTVNYSRVEFESMGSPMGNRRSSRIRGEVEFRPSRGGMTEAIYLIEMPRSRGLMAAAWVVQTIGLAAIVLGFWAVKTFVVDSPSAAVRAQAFQMVQVIHILWPPFLLGGLAVGPKRAARNQIHALVSNLPYLPD